MSLTWSDPESRERPKPEAKLPLFDTAHARRSDPLPSHQAAAKVTNLGRTRDAIIWILKHFGPKTDEQLIAAYKEAPAGMGFKKATDQSIRSRRAELVRLGFVEDSGLTGKTQTGYACTIWSLK